MLSYLVLEKIFYNFWESFAKLIGNFAKINDFIFAKFKIIFSKLRVSRNFKMLFRNHPTVGLPDPLTENLCHPLRITIV